jgi:NAD(P)-dependent dehydrogenase (short-subunit alcohol dehydrogenase family)
MPDVFDVAGKVALVTGGATGIGKAIAQAFINHGARVLIGSRTKQTVEKAVSEMAPKDVPDQSEPRIAGVSLDVTNDNSVERGCRRAVELFGQLDVLVNCAGNTVVTPTFELTTDAFNQIHDTHVTGSLRCCQAAGHIFREQHAGCIINIASISSLVDIIEATAYAAAKNAVIGLTRSFANEWGKYGIRTNGIAPGFVPTALNRHLLNNTDRGRRVLERTPMGRFGEPHEIAGTAIFLASPAASFVNGHTLVVDGGYMACGVGDCFAPWAPDPNG